MIYKQLRLHLVWFGWVLWHINHCRLYNTKSSFIHMYQIYVIWFGLVWWHINHSRLFNAKSSMNIYIKYIWFGLYIWPPWCLIIVENSQQCPSLQPTFTSNKVQLPKPNITLFQYHTTTKKRVKKIPLGRCQKRYHHFHTYWYPNWLVQHHGYYCKEKWETKEDSRLPASKFPVQTGNTPHQLAIPTVVTGITIHKKKLVYDSMDDYFSIPLDEESQPATTFIRECCRFMYLRMPQGYLDSSDAYTRRYDDIIKEVPCKVKIVDDNFNKTIKEAFYKTLDYLLLESSSTEKNSNSARK